MYIWEALLEAEDTDREVSFLPADGFSPYLEVSCDDLNPNDWLDKPVQVNAWYRFAEICDVLFSKALGQSPQVRDRMFDVILHHLGWMDLRSGLCRNEYFGLFLRKDIENGRFGKNISSAFALFTRTQRRFILENLVRLYRLAPSIELLRSMMRNLFPNSLLYLDTDEGNELLIYLGKKETLECKQKIDFILAFFMPLRYQARLFWNMHFGIIGVDDTMEMDEIYLY